MVQSMDMHKLHLSGTRPNIADLTFFAPGEYPVFEIICKPISMAVAKQFSYSGRGQLWGFATLIFLRRAASRQ